MLALLTGLTTALVGGVVAAFITYRLNATKEHVFHMRRKAEELFLAFDKHETQVAAHFLSYFPLLKGQITYNEFLKSQLKSKNDEGSSFASFKMISSIYFHGMQNELFALEDAHSKVNTIIFEHNRAYRAGSGSGFLSRFNAALQVREEASKALRAAIISEARAMMGTERLWPEWHRITTAASVRLGAWKAEKSSP